MIENPIYYVKRLIKKGDIDIFKKECFDDESKKLFQYIFIIRKNIIEDLGSGVKLLDQEGLECISKKLKDRINNHYTKEYISMNEEKYKTAREQQRNILLSMAENIKEFYNFNYWIDLKDKIGVGAHGEVYETLNPKYVVKKIKIEKNDDRLDSFQQFLMALIAGYENDNNVASHVAIFEDSGYIYIVMEKHGQNVSSYIKNTNLPIKQKIKLMHNIFDAVESMHDNGVIHGDLKPANILIDQSGEIRIIDFPKGQRYTDLLMTVLYCSHQSFKNSKRYDIVNVVNIIFKIFSDVGKCYQKGCNKKSYNKKSYNKKSYNKKSYTLNEIAYSIVEKKNINNIDSNKIALWSRTQKNYESFLKSKEHIETVKKAFFEDMDDKVYEQLIKFTKKMMCPKKSEKLKLNMDYLRQQFKPVASA